MKMRGQITIFVIISIIIVVVAIGIFYVYPKIESSSTSTTPIGRIQDCLENDLKNNVEKISFNGGSLNPELYTTYYNGGKKFTPEYLCYTDEDYLQCVMQQPLLKSHIEKEIKSAIDSKVKTCFDNLESNYKKEGYTVSLEKRDYEVIMKPQGIDVVFDYDLTLTKGSTNKYNEFVVGIDSNLYRLVDIANEIANGEAQYGDADVSGYMTMYYWLKAEKIKQTWGTKIYILTDRESDEMFMFASRSVVLPPGY